MSDSGWGTIHMRCNFWHSQETLCLPRAPPGLYKADKIDVKEKRQKSEVFIDTSHTTLTPGLGWLWWIGLKLSRGIKLRLNNKGQCLNSQSLTLCCTHCFPDSIELVVFVATMITCCQIWMPGSTPFKRKIAPVTEGIWGKYSRRFKASRRRVLFEFYMGKPTWRWLTMNPLNQIGPK